MPRLLDPVDHFRLGFITGCLAAGPVGFIIGVLFCWLNN